MPMSPTSKCNTRRAGSYPQSIALAAASQRLQRYVMLRDPDYIVSPSIRESISFAVHNLTTDPRFSRLDLSGCGSVFLDLDPETRQRLLRLLHFALQPGGCLFLPSCEALGPEQAEPFAPSAAGRQIFRRATRKAQQHLAGQLESSRLQLMNDELSRLNLHLQDRMREVTAANDGLTHLLASADIEISTLRQAEKQLPVRQQALMRAHAALERRVAERTQWLSLLHELSQSITEAPTWDMALQQVLELLCHREEWQIGYVYLPDPQIPSTVVATISCMSDERFLAFHELSEQLRYRMGEALPGRVFAEGNPVYARDVAELLQLTPVRAAVADRVGLCAGIAFPIKVNREVIAVLELFSDRLHPRNDWFDHLMPAVTDQISRVLERERTTARMADLVWREQQDLLHTLHDALGQTLTGLGMLSSGLRQRLAVSDERAADIAGEIARQAQQALEQVRQLSRSLFPVEVEAASLTAALRALAFATESLHKVRVRVAGEALQRLVDGATATQLYRIAQEAVTNAIKHAQARTISVHIEVRRAVLKLRIVDDGVGIGTSATRGGIGLQIMRYRTQSIGGTLTVDAGTERGTVVTCTVRAPPRRRRTEPVRSPSDDTMEGADVEAR